MWIPAYTQPRDPDVRLAVITSAQALGAAVGVKKILLGIYEQIMMTNPPDQIGRWIKVSTHDIAGVGLQINVVEAYYAHEEGMLQYEQRDQATHMHSHGLYPYVGWRMLNVKKLWEFLEDKELPKPSGS